MEFYVCNTLAAARRLDNALRIVKESGLTEGMERVYMSGGGAFKYEAKIEEELGLRSVPVDEFEALVGVLTTCLHTGHLTRYTRWYNGM